jgi:phosphatidylglycerol lysyltransferase
MYAIAGRSWVAMGDAVGDAAATATLSWRFCAAAAEHGGWPVFYQVEPSRLPLYLDLGLGLFKLGEEALVPLADFPARIRKDLRRAHAKAGKEGCSFAVIPREEVPARLAEMRAVSDAWLTAKRVREKRFSLGFFNEAYLREFPAALVLREGRMVAFANLWPSEAKRELSVDLMRFASDAPKGTMDFLLYELMAWGRAQGYARFNLGMAPLSGIAKPPVGRWWTRLGALLYGHGENLYQFQGLRAYKEKFAPEWEPRYLACPGGLALPRIVADLAALVAGRVGRLGPVAEVEEQAAGSGMRAAGSEMREAGSGKREAGSEMREAGSGRQTVDGRRPTADG